MQTQANPQSNAPYSTVIRPGKPLLRTTYQFNAQADGDESKNLAIAVDAVLEWLQQKFPETIPTAEHSWAEHRIEHFGQVLDIVGIRERLLWTAKLTQPDSPFRDRAAVPGRTWFTDVSVLGSPDRTEVSVHVSCATLPGVEAPAPFLTRPGIAPELASRLNLRDSIRPVAGLPWVLSQHSDIEELVSLLESPERLLPVILLTKPDGRQYPVQLRPYLLDETFLAKTTQTLAHVVLMSPELAFAWTERVGKEWSAFLGAVRVYLPQLSFLEDSPYRHPLTLTEKVLFWQYSGKDGEEAYASFLIDKCRESSATRRKAGSTLFIPEARLLHAEQNRSRSQDSSELTHLYEEENTALREKVAGLEDQLREYDELTKDATEERDYYRAENARLRTRSEALHASLEAARSGAAQRLVAEPKTYEELVSAIDEELIERLILHPRARRSLKEAVYENLSLVWDALKMLANEYRNLQLGHPGAKELFDTECNRLHLEYGNSISKTKAGEQGEEYFVRYPPSTFGRRTFLEWHLGRGAGNNRDPRTCLRIYFFWSADESLVVVGWLPSHLDNRLT